MSQHCKSSRSTALHIMSTRTSYEAPGRQLLMHKHSTQGRAAAAAAAAASGSGSSSGLGAGLGVASRDIFASEFQPGCAGGLYVTGGTLGLAFFSAIRARSAFSAGVRQPNSSDHSTGRPHRVRLPVPLWRRRTMAFPMPHTSASERSREHHMATIVSSVNQQDE
jgi:hypothetical protein